MLRSAHISWPAMEAGIIDLRKAHGHAGINVMATDKSGQPAKKKAKKRKIHYDPVVMRAWCKGCGICSEFCPKKVIGLDDMGMPVVERPDDCTGCRFCELHCPDFAITVKERRLPHKLSVF